MLVPEFYKEMEKLGYYKGMLFFEKAEGIMDTETDSLIIVPATDRGIRNSITFGCGFDKKLALREYNVIVI